jgi:hypothetical protein
MAAADQQFLDALKYLGQTGQQYGIKQQMDDVNQRAQEIQSTMTDEIQKRAALRNLAQTANLSVSGSGGSGQDAAAINNLIPPIPTSVQHAFLQGSLTGDSQMVDVARKMQSEDEGHQIRLMEKKAALALMLEKQKDAGKTSPELMMIRKENRSKYDDLLTSRQKAVETLAKLNQIKPMLNEGVFFDTGPIDGRMSPLFPSGQKLEQRMNEISLQNMVSMFSGMSKAVDTDAERRAFESTQLSMRNHPSVNADYIERQKKILKGVLSKANKAEKIYKMTGGMSFDGFDPSSTPTTPGYQPIAPSSGARSFYSDPEND